MIGAAFGLGFILGPAIGAWLSQYGYGTVAFVAAGLSALTIILTYFMLPEPEHKGSAAKRAFSIKALKEAVAHPMVGSLLAMTFTFSIAFAMFQTSFALFAKSRLGFDTQSTGFVLAYVGVLSVIVQLVIVGRLVKKFGEKELIAITVSFLALGLLLMSIVQTVAGLLVVMPLLAIGGGASTPVLTSLITKSVDRSEVGGILGVSTSVDSLSRIIAPILGNALLVFSDALPSLLGVAILMITLFLAIRLRGQANEQLAYAPVPVKMDE
jgi:DHA1 family tetracycline resistance protein-like MFS transporter